MFSSLEEEVSSCAKRLPAVRSETNATDAISFVFIAFIFILPYFSFATRAAALDVNLLFG